MPSRQLVVKTLKNGIKDIEAEMYTALHETGYDRTPEFYGVVQLQSPDSPDIPLMIILEKNEAPPDLRDEKMTAGANTVQGFISVLEEVGKDKDGEISDLKRRIETSLDIGIQPKLSFRELLIKISHAIAGFHSALAASSQQGFGVQPATAEDVRRIQEHDVEQILKDLLILSQNSPMEIIPHFSVLTQEILQLTQDVILQWPLLHLSRAHGDMQMDQLLLDRFYDLVLLDLGGSPLHTVEQRRLRGMVVQDIAGIIRALGYIRYYVAGLLIFKKHILTVEELQWLYTASRPGSRMPPHPSIDVIQAKALIESAKEIESQAGVIVVTAYLDFLESTANTGLLMSQWNRKVAETIIHYHVLTRALYEMKYELSSRAQQGRVLIPLAGLEELLTRFASPGQRNVALLDAA